MSKPNEDVPWENEEIELQNEVDPDWMKIRVIGWGMLMIVAFALVVLGVCTVARAQTAPPVTVVWAANTEEDLAGYVVLYGPRSGDYAYEIDTADTTLQIFWPDDEPLYAVVKAYDQDGNISAPGPEAVKLPFVQSSEKVLDINGDGIIDIDDGREIRRFYGLRPGRVGWVESLDLNNDGIIDVDDRRIIRKNYGRKVAP